MKDNEPCIKIITSDVNPSVLQKPVTGSQQQAFGLSVWGSLKVAASSSLVLSLGGSGFIPLSLSHTPT